MSLSGKWLQNKRSMDDKEKFKQLLLADTVILGRLYEIIEEYEKELDQGEFSTEEYMNPAFPYLKADRIGERRAYRKLKQLLSFIND